MKKNRNGDDFVKKLMRFLPVVLTFVIVMLCFPTTVHANPTAGVEVGVRKEVVNTVNPNRTIYRMVFTASAPGGFNLFNINFSFDSGVVMPVDNLTHGDVMDITHGATVPSTSLRMRLVDNMGRPFQQHTLWSVQGGRTGLSYTAFVTPAYRPTSSARVDVFALYFRIIGNNVSSLTANTFRIEDARQANMQTALAADFGILLDGASGYFIWGTASQMPSVHSRRVVISDNAVNLWQPGAFDYADVIGAALSALSPQVNANLRAVDGKIKGVPARVQANQLIASSNGQITAINNPNGTPRDINYIGTGTMIVFSSGTELTVVVFGDADGNGLVDVVDILLIRQYILNRIFFNDIYMLASNVNGDDTVNVLDILLIQQYILGRIDMLSHLP